MSSDYTVGWLLPEDAAEAAALEARTFDWVASAVDALTMPHHFLDAVKDWPIERVAYELEKYNGFGYRLQNTGVNTAYLWAWSNHHTKGKFIGDHQFDPGAPEWPARRHGADQSAGGRWPQD